ncbi:F-box/LRR-repeat protein At2g43260-like [Oryza brachyantha]|uniref:F-box domain-containing protein n=1 Tax=Oryza brachyantha TaxID=4533 RepID=J3MJP4_ORYBR|nr:F-box/LRR-repeat protein At2g43260-like [Oryza brachyantha]
MASPEPCAAAEPGGGFGAVDGALAPELLFEVMQRLPAKPMCRLRAVCRSWLAFTTDPLFLAAYAARHPHPLLAVLEEGSPTRRVDLVDLSGNVVKEIRGVREASGVVRASSGRVLVHGENHGVTVVDPATGSMAALPFGLAEDTARRCGALRTPWIAFGQTASTGEHKLLRIFEDMEDGIEAEPVCEVLTVSDVNGQWRKMESPPGYLDPSCTNGVVFRGAAYFFLDLWQLDPSFNTYFATGCIPSFDLVTEQWGMHLQGPVNRILEEANGTLSYADLTDRLMLSELKGTLSTAHWNDRILAVDIWFLVDFEKGVWSKEYRINVGFAFEDFGDAVQPLVVADDGKVVLWLQTGSNGMVWVYNPVTDTSSEIIRKETSIDNGIGVYTGNQLCPGSV